MFVLLASAVLGLVGTVWGLVVLAVSGWGVLGAVSLAAGLSLLVVAIMVFGRRSKVVDSALGREHFGSALLSATNSTVDHVWCATEVQSGDHLYFGRQFLYSYRFGVGVPAMLPLSTAVQSSACFPGAFAFRRLPTAPHMFVRSPAVTRPQPPATKMILADGGVYDNMAEQWLIGLPNRLARYPSLPVTAPEIDEIVVVNASAGWEWEPCGNVGIPLVGEVLSLVRAAHIMHDVTTSRRRVALVNAGGNGPLTALVHIAQSPYRVANSYAWGTDEFGEAAAAVLAWLEGGPLSEAEWDEIVAHNVAVPTVLRKLGLDVAITLAYHSYVLAACNLRILLGYPLPATMPTLADFEAQLISGDVAVVDGAA